MIKKIMTLAAIFMLCVMGTQAQVLKGADLEKYAKQRYGDRWVDAATNLASSLVLDKNQSLTYQEVIERDLKVMDASAITICRENRVPCIRVFGLDDPENILRVMEGDPMGTIVHS